MMVTATRRINTEDIPDICLIDGKSCKIVIFNEDEVVEHVDSIATYGNQLWGIKDTSAASTCFRYIAFPIKSVTKETIRQTEIKEICNSLENVWSKHPELRLCQLIEILSKKSDSFYVPDETIKNELKSFEGGH